MWNELLPFAFSLWLIMHKYSITVAVCGIPRRTALLIIVAIKRNMDKRLLSPQKMVDKWKKRPLGLDPQSSDMDS